MKITATFNPLHDDRKEDTAQVTVTFLMTAREASDLANYIDADTDNIPKNAVLKAFRDVVKPIIEERVIEGNLWT